MATGDTVLALMPVDFAPENSGNPSGGEYGLVSAGLGKALGFNDGNDSGAIVIRRLPATASFATGATVKILVTDDPNNPCAGLVARFGVNFGVLATNTLVGTAALGTEALGNITLSTTSGGVKELSIPIVVANMASAAANTWTLFRLRRIGTNSADTATGRVLVLGVTILDT